MMAYLVGFDGGREEAIEFITQAAAYPGESQAEAQFALVLIYNREREFDDAQRVLSELKRQFPRNRLLWLESAATWLRDDHAEQANRELSRGLVMLAQDNRTRMHSEDALWMLKRGSARVALGRLDVARPDLDVALGAESKPWLQGRAHVEFGNTTGGESSVERAATGGANARRRHSRNTVTRLPIDGEELSRTPPRPIS
jgi:tetratricopeptide (TPR) repeat protein